MSLCILAVEGAGPYKYAFGAILSVGDAALGVPRFQSPPLRGTAVPLSTLLTKKSRARFRKLSGFYDFVQMWMTDSVSSLTVTFGFV